MAIFYNHIKGCGVNTTGVSETLNDTGSNGAKTNESWGWITWPSKLKYVKTEGNEDLRYVDNCPELRVCNINSKPDDTQAGLSLGKFILSNAQNQAINEHFCFNRTMDIYSETKKVLMTSNKNSSNPLVTIHQDCWVTSGKSLCFSENDYNNKSYNYYAQIYWDKTKENNRWLFNIHNSDASIEFSASAYCFHRGNVLFAGTIRTPADIECEGKCQAHYFNATSDSRAKSNITPTEFSALQVVNSISTYTFNYTNKQEKTIGLIAQEAAEFNLDGFNMVDNLEATGQDGDFMQMKESKLVYVLWKAVQELSAEVEELKAEIRNLK